MRLVRPVLVFVVVVGGTVASGNPRPARAHSFYDLECCSNRDCMPVPDEEIMATKEGWRVRTTGEVIGYDSWPIKHSPDGRFHRCAGLGNFGPKGRTQCLYVPDFGQ
ncbi:hypothetical protein GGQ64_001150 [Rhizobium azooxidifex]|uniref:Uncharacterized protein n=1 Tax=Mycoplana azooxidifex TaxID=1636188 RepID=A0A7W6GIA6_9HYPH|nr:hypothetical protein [Mycoplana azooxidifex]MBB3975963.1 hypothetical protein [Mycoplana azooxidifex]